MVDISDIALKTFKKLYPNNYKFDGQLSDEYTKIIDPGASQIIHDKILLNKPLMISRFGSTELNCLVNYLGQKDRAGKYLDYITGKSKFYKWEKYTLQRLCTLSGFFPESFELVEQFCETMLDDISHIDILGSWLKGEALFESELKHTTKVGFRNLEPYNHDMPWSRALEGMTVLVIHPFDESIRSQYKNRKLLFNDPNVLPDFELKTIKAVQSIANSPTQYENWFEALDSMKQKINEINFDVAIIGCGAYGMPLAAHVKKEGKKAIHLGGVTQMLFGISGKRWESEEHYSGYKEKLINQYWVRPGESEMPANFKKVEDGCYW